MKQEDPKHNVWAYITNEEGENIGTRDYFRKDVTITEALDLLEEDGATDILVHPGKMLGGTRPVTCITAALPIKGKSERVTFLFFKPKGDQR